MGEVFSTATKRLYGCQAHGQPCHPFHRRCQHIAEVVGTEVQAAEPNQHDQQEGGEDAEDAPSPLQDALDSEAGQQAVKQHGGDSMSTRETCAAQVHEGMRESRAGAVEDVCQEHVQECSTRNHQHQIQEPIPLPPPCQPQRHDHGDGRDDRSRTQARVMQRMRSVSAGVACS